MMSRVNILHCGGIKEIEFINHLKRANAISSMSFDLQINIYREGQSRETIML